MGEFNPENPKHYRVLLYALYLADVYDEPGEIVELIMGRFKVSHNFALKVVEFSCENFNDIQDIIIGLRS